MNKPLIKRILNELNIEDTPANITFANHHLIKKSNKSDYRRALDIVDEFKDKKASIIEKLIKS